MRSQFLLLSTLLELATAAVPAIRTGIKPKNFERNVRRTAPYGPTGKSCNGQLSPKFFIISMFTPEASAWYDIPDFNLLANNITVPGLSPLYPQVYCTASADVCQIIVGEGEINAASSITALWASNCFNLAKTYFMVAGIGGVNPHVATTGGVTFAKYAIQFDLQYEFAMSQIPKNDSSGYFPLSADYPDEYNPRDYPLSVYGTEVFELNDNLKKRAVSVASKAKLNDTTAAQQYRSKYPYAPANQPPKVVACDSGTSNPYWSGHVLGDAFSAYTKLMTNGSGLYCNTQQEDNATLEALLRGALAKKVDFSRIIILRTASDFDRAPPDESETYHLLFADQAGFEISLQNIYLAGIEVVKDVLKNWKTVYERGVKADNYIGDLINSLGSPIKPDIGGGIADPYIN